MTQAIPATTQRPLMDDPSNGNPVVAEIDQAHSQLSEPAKQALSILGSNISQQPPSSLISPAVASGNPMSGIKPDLPAAMHTSSVAAPSGPVAAPAHQAELARLTTGDTGKPGVSQIHNPVLRGLAHVGDIAESLFFPAAAAFTPGTTLNHARLVRNARNNVVADDESRVRNAQAAEQESLPEFHALQAQNVADKAQAIRDVGEARAEATQSETQRKADADKAKGALSLAQHGFKLDETGKVVPLPYEEMSQEQQAVHDLKASQSELADAQKSYNEAKTKNIPAQLALAQRRIENANHTASIAAERLGLSEKQFALKVGGEDEANAHPGQMVDNGKTVGTAFQQNVRPTGAERNKADLANSAHDQIEDIKAIVKKRPDIFGPAAGRVTDFNVWLGSQDPDAQRFRAARTIAGDHLAGVFGGRSQAALEALDSAIGHFKDNPAALEAGLDQLQKANSGFQKAGTIPRAGQSPARPKGVPPNATWNPQTRHWEAP